MKLTVGKPLALRGLEKITIGLNRKVLHQLSFLYLSGLVYNSLPIKEKSFLLLNCHNIYVVSAGLENRAGRRVVTE